MTIVSGGGWGCDRSKEEGEVAGGVTVVRRRWLGV